MRNEILRRRGRTLGLIAAQQGEDRTGATLEPAS